MAQSTRTPRTSSPALVAFALAAALATVAALAALAACPLQALALEDENLVDPTQRADNSFIYDTTIESLVEQATLYDGRQVQVEGEVIGDRINAHEEGFCWITLTVLNAEDKTTVFAHLSDEQASQIDHYGMYGVTGTVLQVRGTYNQVCQEHDGLPDIHATSSEVVMQSAEHRDELVAHDFAPGMVAVLLGAALMAMFYIARERTR